MGEESSVEQAVRPSEGLLLKEKPKEKPKPISLKDYPPKTREILEKILEEKNKVLNSFRERASERELGEGREACHLFPPFSERSSPSWSIYLCSEFVF